MSTTRPRRLRRALAATLGVLTALGATQVVLAQPASAGQLGLTIEIQGAGTVRVVEGSIEDGGPTVCGFPDVQDQREVNACPRIRDEEVFAASVWLRPEPAPGWAFDRWDRCDDIRQVSDDVFDCKVTSSAFGTSEKSVLVHFRDTVRPEVSPVTQHYSTTRDRTVSFDFTINKGHAECLFADAREWVRCESGVEHTWPEAGSYRTNIRAVDASGRSSQWQQLDSYVIDTDVTSGPPAVVAGRAAEFVVHTRNGPDLRCQVDGGLVFACGQSGAAFTVTVDTDGAHTLVVYGESLFGRDWTPARWSWTVDETGPDTVAQPPVAIGPTSVEVPFTGDADTAWFECRLSDAVSTGQWLRCESPVRFFDLADGAYVVEVRAVDALGNPDATPARQDFTITAPVDPAPVTPTTGTVVRVVDADTVVVQAGTRRLTIDLAGLDQPKVGCHGRRGTAALRTLAPVGSTLRLVPTGASENAGASPWTVLARGTDLALAQLRAGHATFARSEAPATRRAGYAAAQQTARRAHRGLWGSC
ncbi:hypothetical protein GCM10023340_10780 [Nocardioides marinquilinus]|uniref:TNase-like domain-containing protein n=1 Tax=Nocardioides marinquilinus TaxID=1210400 RepID=A0ABP9PBK5_9ACTN